jgi:hypothetical protein
MLCLIFFIFGLFLAIVLVYLGYKIKLQNFISVYCVKILFPSFLKNPEGGVQLSGLMPPAHCLQPWY